IVCRRSEPARDENDFCPGKDIPYRDANRGPIRNDALFLDLQAKLKNFTSDKCQVRIRDVTQQNLGAGVDDDNRTHCAHYALNAMPLPENATRRPCPAFSE